MTWKPAAPALTLGILLLPTWALVACCAGGCADNRETVPSSVPLSTSDRRSNAEELVAEILSRGWAHEMAPRLVPGTKTEHWGDLYELDIHHYDFDAIQRAEGRIAHLSAQEVCRRLFAAVTSQVPPEHENEKWLRISDAVSRVMRHPPLTQPMYPDKTMVTHPVVLLLLGEGRCGHVARLVVDIALANGYEARLVQLAAHAVAEVKYYGRWHMIDADADFPLDSLRQAFPELPSVEDLAKDPYRIDRLPARGWQWSERDRRTLAGAALPSAMWYPGELLTSSVYFGRQVFQNLYSGDPAKPRTGIVYCRKKGTLEDWQQDKYYGWMNLERTEQAIEPVPTEFHPTPPSLLVPAMVYKKGPRAVVPVRFLPVRRIAVQGSDVFRVRFDPVEVRYEIRVSSRSRGWNYDFRNYRTMPQSGEGDLATLRSVKHYDGGMLGVDVPLEQVEGQVFVEVIAIVDPLRERGAFFWPSQEAAVRIYPEQGKKWDPKGR